MASNLDVGQVTHFPKVLEKISPIVLSASWFSQKPQRPLVDISIAKFLCLNAVFRSTFYVSYEDTSQWSNPMGLQKDFLCKEPVSKMQDRLQVMGLGHECLSLSLLSKIYFYFMSMSVRLPVFLCITCMQCTQ